MSETFLILRTIQRDIVINVETLSCKVPAVSVRFQLNLNTLDKFSKNPKIKFDEKCLVGAELLLRCIFGAKQKMVYGGKDTTMNYMTYLIKQT